uniref:F-box protein At3g26010-like beta-propeller domain-containing protein n=1 Tax=Tanacetum cinerariifolium TaxID=118510 RepID=A0A699H3J5_TANCI|nr:hypothetical protein [Tanacetum cinerariifolium]
MSKVEAVDRTLKAKEEVIQTIKFHLLRAQNRMKQQADKGRMAFDPTKSPHYKVVYASISDENDDVIVSIQIQTYSSETGNWDIVCSDPFPIRCFSGFQSGIHWNDGIHWLTDSNYGSGYLHYKLDFVNERPTLTNVQLPGTLHDWDRKLFESHGCLLLLGMAKTHSLQLNVYKMRNGNSEWSFKYFVNLCDIIKPISGRWIMRFRVLCIALGESE